MDRTKIILEGIGKEALGIEVAPWLAPVAARRDGYNVRIIDVFDTETLRSRGPADPHQADRDLGLLEEVDWVGSATEIATLVPADLHGKIDYIVSSHNFEHLANPIKFLNGCATVLRPGGILTMAVPDRRGCFDFFRPHTVIGDWIEAFREDRQRPTPRQVFDSKSMSAELRRGDETFHAFHLGENARDIGVTGKLLPQFAVWEAARPADEYTDAHCTVMTPGSLELLLFEARALGLITLETVSLRETDTFEFYVRLRKPVTAGTAPGTAPVGDVEAERVRLMRKIVAENRIRHRWRLFPHLPRPAWQRRVVRAVRGFGRRLRGATDR